MRRQRIAIGLVVCGMVLVFSLVVGDFWQLSSSVRELSDHEIGPKFEMVTGRRLPGSAKNLRAVFWRSRDPAIFVVFETDAEGVAYVKRVFGGPSVKAETLDEARLKAWALSGWQPFWPLSAAEKKLQIRLFDLESLKSALWLQQIGEHGGPPGYDVLIDFEKSIVYIKALRI